jgi:AAA+ superfamily predicted ATPase/Tfp pilus assembly protein PilF
MPVDEGVVAALEGALERDPANTALALHLAEVLISAGRPGDALARCREVLSAQPADVGALEVALRAADEAGNEAAADGYRAVLAGLRGGEPDQEPATVVPLRVFEGGGGSDDDLDVERPTVKLADVGGLEDVKRKLNTAFLGPMRNPELRKAYGKSLRGGLMLYGPPGCGKTFVARAVAGELGARFTAVGINDVLDMYIGESERKLHELFQTARRNAPCVLFLDEVDALGQKRSHLRHSGIRGTVNQLLAELDNASSGNEGVFVLAATNHPWDVDTALRRPGRFDRMLLVLPPDEPAREAILRLNLRERPLADDVEREIGKLAARTSTFSGADLAHVCETAAEAAMEASMESGDLRPISAKDINRALKETQPSTRVVRGRLQLRDVRQRGRAVRRAAGLHQGAPAVVSGAAELALALQQLGRHGQAAEALREALAAEPEDPELYCRLALALASDGRHGEALRAAERAVTLAPDWEWPHRLRAAVLREQGRHREALEPAAEAVRLAPESSWAWETLADVRLSARDRAGAREAAERARALGPERTGPLQSLADVAAASGDHAEAERHLRAALALDPEDAELRNNLGVELQHQGRHAEARAAFESAARGDPRLSTPRENLTAAGHSHLDRAIVVFAVWAFVVYGMTLVVRGLVAGLIGVGLLLVAAVVYVVQRRRRMDELSAPARALVREGRR